MGSPSMSLRHCARQILGAVALGSLHTVAMGAPGPSDFVVFDGQTYAYGSAELIHALNNRSIRLIQSCANMIEADFLLHRGWFHRCLATAARARLSTG